MNSQSERLLNALNTLGEEIQAMSVELQELKQWKSTIEAYPDLPPVLTAKDISVYTKVSLSKAYGEMKSGDMKIFRVGTSPRCAKADFISWMEKGGGKQEVKR